MDGDSFSMEGHSSDACLRLVADRNRRRIIQQLRHESSSETTVDDLVDRLHSDGSVSDDDRRISREQLAIDLYHSSLPKLDAHGVIEYDRERGIVRYQPNELVETVLDSIPGAVAVSNP